MTHPFGKAPIQVGTIPTPAEMPIYQGTTPADLQRILGAQYMASGLLPNGGGQSSGTSSMAYKVAAGAAFMWASSSAKLGMLVPFEATTVQTDPAPATGTRVDSLYVDGNGDVRVAIGSKTVPAGVKIGEWGVPAGVTATTSALLQPYNKFFAIATGASLGQLHRFHDPANGVWGNISPMKLGQGKFSLPSDRLVEIRHTWTASAEPAGSDQRTWGVARWFVHVTGPTNSSHATNWHYQGIHPNTQFLNITLNLQQGDYEIHYIQERMGGARFRHHKGGPDGWLGNRFEVWDAGAAR